MADNKKVTSLDDVRDFIVDEIEQTEIALAFVEAEIASGTKTQFNAIYVKKRAEYGGVVWALNAVLDIIDGKEPETS